MIREINKKIVIRNTVELITSVVEDTLLDEDGNYITQSCFRRLRKRMKTQKYENIEGVQVDFPNTIVLIIYCRGDLNEKDHCLINSGYSVTNIIEEVSKTDNIKMFQTVSGECRGVVDVGSRTFTTEDIKKLLKEFFGYNYKYPKLVNRLLIHIGHAETYCGKWYLSKDHNFSFDDLQDCYEQSGIKNVYVLLQACSSDCMMIQGYLKKTEMSIIVQDVYPYKGLDQNYLAEKLAKLWDGDKTRKEPQYCVALHGSHSEWWEYQNNDGIPEIIHQINNSTNYCNVFQLEGIKNGGLYPVHIIIEKGQTLEHLRQKIQQREIPKLKNRNFEFKNLNGKIIKSSQEKDQLAQDSFQQVPTPEAPVFIVSLKFRKKKRKRKRIPKQKEQKEQKEDKPKKPHMTLNQKGVLRSLLKKWRKLPVKERQNFGIRLLDNGPNQLPISQEEEEFKEDVDGNLDYDNGKIINLNHPVQAPAIFPSYLKKKKASQDLPDEPYQNKKLFQKERLKNVLKLVDTIQTTVIKVTNSLKKNS